MTISNELLDSLLADYKTPEDLIGEGELLKQLTKRLVARALQTEMVEHLGYAKHESVANQKGKGCGLGAGGCPRLATWCPKIAP
ncbi:hypothetical protein Acife_1354 [Acidithiobacillus ferrivorans SS3]|uniref:Transposase n=1 Tax=Acidithiobacillus ferrivorans SS3 TaxID=743299 RepID=G0JQH4_9PROT|nr:hypothetical protein Acife_1354 [Acidithiobacillus ferrivorans SS3]OFA17412.1 hypothetical protein A4U49_02815 [Acidithiobacillus ferrivorans]